MKREEWDANRIPPVEEVMGRVETKDVYPVFNRRCL